ncbi:MAG: AsmA family protein [Chitinophagaceae bacterium]|nr:AsmA family protein [Chitinophagaceae bacterium]
MLKKILKITGITLLVLLILLFTAPYLFKDKITKIVKEQINKNVAAKVDFTDLSLSFFRHFPNASVALENLQVTGPEPFGKDTLIAAREIDAAVDLFSLFGDQIRVTRVNIDQPRIHALMNKEGKSNWDIMLPDTTTATPEKPEEPSSFKMNLKKYAIREAYIYYSDATSGMSAEINNLTHEGSGDFTSDLFTLRTGTNADAITFTYAGIPYLARTKTNIDLDIEIDSKNSKYTFNTEEIALNDLKIAAKGFFQLVNDSTYNMDIAFNAPSTEFKSILSLIPSVYANDFAKVKTSGKALLNGFVKGTYNGTKLPAFNLNLQVDNGFFQYPDLPKPVQNINLQVKVDNPDGVIDNTVVDIPKAHIEFGSDPFDLHLLLKKPMTDQYIDAGAKGKLDLAGVTQFVKLPEGTKLSGLVNADINAKGNMAVVTQQKPGPFSAQGFVDISKLFYSSPAFPAPIQNTSARIDVTNPDGVPDHTVVKIPAAHVEVGKDMADLTLTLLTPASDPAFDGTLKGGFNLGNVGQFYTFGPGTSLAGQVNADMSFKGKKSMIDKSQYDAVQMAGTVQANGISYKSKDYPDGVNITNSLFTFNPKNVTVNNLAGNFMQTNFNANGSFDNLIGYAMKDEPLAGTLNVNADKVDLNKFMGTTPASEAPAAEAKKDSASAPAAGDPFQVPKNIKFALNTKVNSLHYDKVDYKNISGALQIADETVYMKDVKLEALDGTIGLGGSYSTRVNKKKPEITLNYDVQNLDIQKTFFAYNTVQKLMPIGKFIAGKLTSKMSVKGNLGGDMMPDLTTLTGEGNLFLLQGVLSKFGPLDKLASTLNLNDLQNFSVKDIKNYFEFANGKVLVKPFNVKVKDIDMEIGGMHGLDQSLDYVINLKVPREKLGSQANQLVNNLASQANAKGVPVNISETISFKVNLGGSITNPSIKTDLKGSGSSLAQDMKAQADQFVEAKKKAADSAIAVAKQQAKDSLESAKKQAAAALKEELTKQLSGKKDTSATGESKPDLKKDLENTGKGLLNNLLKKKKNPADSTKQ